LAASIFGLALFCLGCVGLWAFPTGAAVGLFAPAVAWEALAFGPMAAVAAAAMAGVAAGGVLGAGGYWTALICALATVQIGVVNALIGALSLKADALREARRGEAMQAAIFAETQHRVGNSLSVICSALDLQARRSSDPATRRALRDAGRRVLLIAEVNRMLNDSQREGFAFDAAFVERLAGKSIEAHGAEGRVRCSVYFEPIDMRPDFVLPLALALGESLSNALEHGFPGEAAGSITVRLEAEGAGRRRLTIGDDGAGLPPGFDAQSARSTGLTLIRAFARQVGGDFRLESDGTGARSILTFQPDRKNPDASSAPG
jgi:two-component sensor histidine kinase